MEQKIDIIKKFDDEAELLHNRFEQQDWVPTLYYYRGSRGSFSILHDREIRFANYKHLQQKEDKAEVALGHAEIMDCIKEMALDAPLNMRDFWTYFYKEFFALLARQSIYILSLSCERGSEGLLKKYIKGNGAVFSFGFGISPPAGKMHFHLLKVFYDVEDREFKNRIREFLLVAEKYCLQIQASSLIQKVALNALAVSLASHLLLYIPVRKSKDSNGEDLAFETEYRLVMPGFFDNEGNRHPEKIPPELFRRVEEYAWDTHVAYNFKDEELKEVLLVSRDIEFEKSLREAGKEFKINKLDRNILDH